MRVEIPAVGAVELGTTETAPTIGITDYSRRVTDDFGVTTVVQRGFSRRMSVRLALPTGDVDALQRRLADLRATAATWVADDRYDSLRVNGFYKDFSLDLAVPPVSFCTLTIEGLAETTAFVDGGGDPAPAGQSSTLRLLQPIEMTDAGLSASSVPETDYPEWAVGATYAAGDRVIKAATHRVYESAVAANIGNDPVSTGKWIDIGPTNRWAMFDQALGSLTQADGSIIVTLDPASAANAVALLDVTGATVRVQAAGYDRLVAATGTALFLDMPLSDGPVTVSVAGPGTVSVGTLLIGQIVGLGVTESAPSAGITDYSRKETGEFGEVTVVQRAWAKRMSVAGLISTDAIDLVFGRIASVRAVPSLWIGDEALESITVYGFFKDFSIEVGENVSKLSLSIEGLSAAAKIEPIGVGEDIREELDTALEEIAKEQMRAAIWRGESDAVIYMADGTAVRTTTEALRSITEENRAYVAFLKEVGTDGRARFMLVADSDGAIASIEGMSGVPGSEIPQLKFRGRRFIFVDDDGNNPINVMVYEGGVWKMKSVEIDTLKVGSVIRQSINPGAVTDSASFIAPDVMITSAAETTMIETPLFSVGDALYGKALASVSFLQDATSNYDTSIQCRTYLDSGTGYQMIRDRIVGMDVDSGNARYCSERSYTIRLSSVDQVRIKVTGQASYLPSGWGNLASSFARDIAIDLFRGQR